MTTTVGRLQKFLRSVLLCSQLLISDCQVTIATSTLGSCSVATVEWLDDTTLNFRWKDSGWHRATFWNVSAA